MFNELFEFLLNIPQTLSQFGSWLITPLNEQWLNISPLGLLGVGGIGFIIVIITTHIIKLFIS